MPVSRIWAIASRGAAPAASRPAPAPSSAALFRKLRLPSCRFSSMCSPPPPVIDARLASAIHGALTARAARRDGPQRLDTTVSHPDVPVMKVDGRIAVARNQHQLLAELEPRGLGAQLDLAVLVGDAEHLEIGPAVHPGHALLRAVRFQSCVDDRTLGVRHAHHGREHEQAVLEVAVAAALAAFDLRVFDVHEHVGADLKLVPDAARALERVGAGAGPADDLAADRGAIESFRRCPDALRGASDRTLALLPRRQVLRGAVIRLQSAEAQSRGVGDALRELARRRARRDAAALHADVDLDHRLHLDAEVPGHPRRGVDLLGRVEAQTHSSVGRERREAAELRLANDLVAHQHVPHAGLHQRLGLAHLLAALPDRAGGDLLQRDRRTFVRLRVRAQPDAALAREVRHLADVALEGAELDDERRRVDFVDRRADLRGDPVHGYLANSPLTRG